MNETKNKSEFMSLPCRIRRKGKTLGRPSKVEIILSNYISAIYKSDRFQPEITKIVRDEILYGVSYARFDEETCNLKHIPIKEAEKDKLNPWKKYFK